MYTVSSAINAISAGKFDKTFSYVYGENAVEFQRSRYIEAVNEFDKLFAKKLYHLKTFSATFFKS